jgi:thiol-disulfide isomerase/thioredoxin
MGVAQESPQGPQNEKAKKTFQQGLESERKHDYLFALSDFKKADKQDGGHCTVCQTKIIQLGMDLPDFDAAEAAAAEMVAAAQPRSTPEALAHYQYAFLLVREAEARRKNAVLQRAHEEFTKALAIAPKFPAALFGDGLTLSKLNQDAAAKVQFQEYVKLAKADDPQRARAQRYIDDPDLTRARMAPPFALTTIDGKRVSLDDLQGKVVLLDFWATWCGPCREALPRMQKIVKSFQGKPLVVLSVSIDTDENAWKKFVGQNEMTWLQSRDEGFNGTLANLFGVHAIPHTFTIDADGVLQDERIGDAAIEGKLKKLVAKAEELGAKAQ